MRPTMGKCDWPTYISCVGTSGSDGRRLRELRARAGLTQRQVAAWLGVSQPFVSQLEAGESAFTPWAEWYDRMVALFAAFDLRSDDPARLREWRDAILAENASRLLDVPAPRGPYRHGIERSS
jgi:transcriptional regulator with XRE-family HTH domain